MQTYLEQISVVEKGAGEYLTSVVTDKLILCEPDNEELSDMPDFETFNNHGSEGYANLISIEPDKENKGMLLVRGTNKEDSHEVSAYLYELDAYATCAIADYIKATI